MSHSVPPSVPCATLFFDDRSRNDNELVTSAEVMSSHEMDQNLYSAFAKETKVERYVRKASDAAAVQ